MIYLVPSAGLSNRIRAVNSAIQLASFLSRPLQILWTQDALLNCAFNELFRPLENIKVVEEPIKNKLILFPTSIMRFPWNIAGQIGQTLKFDKCLFIKDLNPVWNKEFSQKWLLENISGKRSILLQSDFSFFGDNRNFLFPNEDIAARVEALSRWMSANTIGVHIRRTDHEPAKSQSTDEWFMMRMDECISENENVNFYLASDSEEVKALFKEKYRERLFTIDVENRRDLAKGIRDAYVEVLCLSRTSRIIGSYQSSFSELAAHLGGKKLTVPS